MVYNEFDKEWINLKKCRINKLMISSLIFACIMLCFTFNGFAVNLVVVTQDPQIIIDGRDGETAWLNSKEVVFEVVPEIGGFATVDMLSYKKNLYGAINFYTYLEDEADFILRVDLQYKNNNVCIVFVMNKQLAFYSDAEPSIEAMCSNNDDGYCAEFSFTPGYNAFTYGDLIQVDIRYGTIGELDNYENYENIYGFMGMEKYDFYVGGQIIENSNTQKTTRPNSSSNKTTSSKSTNKATSETEGGQNYKNNNVVLDANYMNMKETEIIIGVMAVTCIVLVIIIALTRKPDEKRADYTDDDKGCD